MREHVHYGPFNILVYGVSAILVMNILRLIGIWAADKPGLEWIAQGIGGVINFTATTEV